MTHPLSNAFGLHASALPLRMERLQTLASNLANADTPGYKARDIDFTAALQAEMNASQVLASSNGAHLEPINPDGSSIGQVWRVPTQPSLDGNTVETDVEQAQFARAALEYRASLSFLEGKTRTLLTAITGQ